MKATYLALLNFTDAGVRNLKQSPQRAKAWRDQTEAAGVTVVAQLWTVGAYDGALLLQAENEQQVLTVLANLAEQGNVRTQSLRAFEAEEFARIIGK
jgi:uncharacterized protein with GYD domain